jgi:hypothetical protein
MPNSASRTGDALTKGTVELLNIAGFAAIFGHHSMPFGWQHSLIRLPGIGVDDRALSIN